jgi:hypothetical protein
MAQIQEPSQTIGSYPTLHFSVPAVLRFVERTSCKNFQLRAKPHLSIRRAKLIFVELKKKMFSTNN